MSYILGDIATLVKQRVRNTNYDGAETIQYINDTINDIFNEYRLPFMQTTQTYTMSTSSSDITNGTGLPTNYVEAIDITVTTNGQEQVIPYREAAELDLIYPDEDDTTRNAANYPLYWYKYGSTIRVFPMPDKAYTLSLRYWKRPTLLANNADVPEVPSEFQELLVVGAAFRILQVTDNYDQAGILENKYQELLQKLVMRYSMPQSGSPKTMPINRYRTPARRLDTIYRRIG